MLILVTNYYKSRNETTERSVRLGHEPGFLLTAFLNVDEGILSSISLQLIKVFLKAHNKAHFVTECK